MKQKNEQSNDCNELELVRENGVLVIAGRTPLDIDIVEWLRQEREELIKHQMGEYYQPPTEDEYGE